MINQIKFNLKNMKKSIKKVQKPKFANFRNDFKEMSREEFMQALFQVIFYIKTRL